MENSFHLNENEEMPLSALTQVQRLAAIFSKNPIEYIYIDSHIADYCTKLLN